jgi:hypothetical protein
LFEVEAMRDGRLAGAELTSFARHLTTCAECAHEARTLEALAETVRSGSDETRASNELAVWRERTRLLAAFDGTLLVPETRFRARRLLLPAAIAAAVACVIVVSRARPDQHLVHSPKIDIRPDAQTVWTEKTEGEWRKIFLSRGGLRIHVDHSAGQGRLLVTLPDGELEDRGTTFTVSAEDGHTTRVAVEEGSVVLRLSDRSEMTIRAGQAWIRETRVTSVEVAPEPSVTAPLPRHASTRLRPSATTAPSPASDISPSEDPTSDFRAAISLLDAGASRQAAAELARFVETHPHDPRAEDAAYLLVIALQRCGSEDDAKRAAQEYLRRYPAGFRRAEVEKLSR